MGTQYFLTAAPRALCACHQHVSCIACSIILQCKYLSPVNSSWWAQQGITGVLMPSPCTIPASPALGVTTIPTHTSNAACASTFCHKSFSLGKETLSCPVQPSEKGRQSLHHPWVLTVPQGFPSFLVPTHQKGCHGPNSRLRRIYVVFGMAFSFCRLPLYKVIF